MLLEFAALYIGTIGCDDRVDAPISSGEGKDLVTVPLSFGFAEESFGELYRNGSPQRLAATGSPQQARVLQPMFRINYTIWKFGNMMQTEII